MSLARLLQLASPTLPVGAYSYSQGLEAAVRGRRGQAMPRARSAGSATCWSFRVARMEAPCCFCLLAAGSLSDMERRDSWPAARPRSCAPRPCRWAIRCNRAAEGPAASAKCRCEEPSFPAGVRLRGRALEDRAAQRRCRPTSGPGSRTRCMAAVKAVPLGPDRRAEHPAGAWRRALQHWSPRAVQMKDEELGNFAPGLALLSSQHETQYSRLFRS